MTALAERARVMRVWKRIVMGCSERDGSEDRTDVDYGARTMGLKGI